MPRPEIDKTQSAQKPASPDNYRHLEYPLGIYEQGSTITLVPTFRHTEFNKEFLADSKIQTTDMKGAIHLPIPAALNETITNEWETALNTNSLAELVVAQVGVKLADALGMFGRKAQVSSGISNVNADIIQLYKGSAPREFQFAWTLLPESQEEALEIRKIIKTLKYFSSPSLVSGHSIIRTVAAVADSVAHPLRTLKSGIAVASGPSGEEVDGTKESSKVVRNENINLSFLSYPATWDIILEYHAPSGGKVKIFEILQCVNTSLVINYNDGESFNFYRDGTPMKITIETSWRETRILTTDKLEGPALY